MGEQVFRGSATFIADSSGIVDLRSSQPLAGSSYDRPDPAGLFWSMTPVPQAGVPSAGSEGIDVGPDLGDVAIELETGQTFVTRAIVRIRPALRTSPFTKFGFRA